MENILTIDLPILQQNDACPVRKPLNDQRVSVSGHWSTGPTVSKALDRASNGVRLLLRAALARDARLGLTHWPTVLNLPEKYGNDRDTDLFLPTGCWTLSTGYRK